MDFKESAPPSTLIITSGPDDSYFHRTALKYAKILEKNGVKVTVLTSNVSLQNLERLADPKSDVDLGIVQGGIRDKSANPENLVSLGGITYQPLMVFYRGKPIEYLSQLRGKAVAVGSVGSGTRKFALRLLKANGIQESDTETTKLFDLDADDAAEALSKHSIDAAFVMTESASDDDVRKLLTADDIHLMSFKQAAAINRKIDYLNLLELPEGGIDLGLDIPITLTGPMVELIATKDLHPALSENAIKVSDDAARFYKSGKSLLYRYLPFWLASLVSRILVVFLPIAVLLIPAIRSVPAFFRWRTQIKIRRRYRELLILEEKFKNEVDSLKLNAIRKNFDRIDAEISKMRVRAAFADQFYSLRGHIDYVRSQMAKKLAPS
jgi:hypothetical protein